MAMSYWPTSEEDKPRLHLFQVELLIWYSKNPNTKHIDDKEHGLVSELSKQAHADLLNWAMIHLSDDTTEEKMSNGTATFYLSDRGREHIKRILKMPLPVGRVVYTLPEEDK